MRKLFNIINPRIPVSKVLWKNHNSNLLNIAKEIANDNVITMYRIAIDTLQLLVGQSSDRNDWRNLQS